MKVIHHYMPARIKSHTIKMEEYYTICLYSHLSQAQNRISYQHEIGHILNGDYDKTCSVDTVEKAAPEK